MKAQAAFEFLVLAALILLLFTMSVGIYFMDMQEGSALNDSMKANSVCMGVASSLNALAATGGNSSYTFALPELINGKNYTVRISAAGRAARVDYGEGGASCALQFANVTNSTGSTLFELGKNATVRNNGGVFVVG
ncbi:Uncharacterised protein [Candidatus Anstonella stagnisolia]|nr:Uncharacterised protein [Candidatus Anstonella stagnisolia]